MNDKAEKIIKPYEKYRENTPKIYLAPMAPCTMLQNNAIKNNQHEVIQVYKNIYGMRLFKNSISKAYAESWRRTLKLNGNIQRI